MRLPNAPLPPDPVPGGPTLPDGAVDTHFHMLAGIDEFPLYAHRVEDPAEGETLDSYLDRYRRYARAAGIARGVVVQSIFYGIDNRVTIEAVRRLGPGYRGIGLVPDGAEDAALDSFVENDLKGVRLNYVHGGVLTWPGVKAMAPRLAERGLHVQMLLNAHKHMDEIADDIRAMPVPVVLDHVGWPDLGAGIAEPGFGTLLDLLGEGHVWVKLSGLYRLADAPYAETDSHVAALVAANPDQCLWGSDWPHIMLNGAEMPPPGALVSALHRQLPDPAIRQRVLVANPARLYGL